MGKKERTLVMHILQVCKKFPFPLHDGESIAVLQLSKGLVSLGCKVSLLTMNTSKHYHTFSQLPKEFAHFTDVHVVDVDNRVTATGVFMNLFSADSYHVSRLRSENFETKLIELLRCNTFDIIQLETTYPAIYLQTIRQNSAAKIVIRSHNVESLIWKRMANNGSFLQKWYFNECARKLENFEQDVLSQIDGLVAITQQDLINTKLSGCKKPIIDLPVGLDLEKYALTSRSKKNISLCFIGSLDWMPNKEGLLWFLKECWTTIYKQNPNIKFHIAGSNLSKKFKELNLPNIVYEGKVPDAKKFISKHDIMVVPIFSGSGIRVKILEGMALGKTIITTQIGKEGINATPYKEILVANTIKTFTYTLQNCIQKPSICSTIGLNAKKHIHQNYDNNIIAAKLFNFYAKITSTEHVEIS